MTDRLYRLRPEQLDADQKAVYDGIAGGDRAQGVQHFPLTADDGSLNGPFGVMLHAPRVGSSLQDLGAAIRYRTSLTARVREIAILVVAQSTGSGFEWWAHERVGRAVGLSDAELEALAVGRFRADDPVEEASAGLCQALLGGGPLDDQAYDAFVRQLGVEAMVELSTLVGYYRTLADLMRVFDVGVPSEG